MDERNPYVAEPTRSEKNYIMLNLRIMNDLWSSAITRTGDEIPHLYSQFTEYENDSNRFKSIH